MRSMFSIKIIKVQQGHLRPSLGIFEINNSKKALYIQRSHLVSANDWTGETSRVTLSSDTHMALQKTSDQTAAKSKLA